MCRPLTILSIRFFHQASAAAGPAHVTTIETATRKVSNRRTERVLRLGVCRVKGCGGRAFLARRDVTSCVEWSGYSSSSKRVGSVGKNDSWLGLTRPRGRSIARAKR
ncbi:MAG: hypothetical protein QOH90_1389 [Actinomycetota bacterium]|nr:hypothetical protein [Actinomycetota bacterium]